MKHNCAAASLVLIFVQWASCQQLSTLVNFRHLERLTEQITFLGERVSIVHVYSNFPDYGWAEAAESGPEGIACVDDAARAAVVYLLHYEQSGSLQSLQRAKSLLKFVLKMQTEDGMFYNFIRADHTINVDGKTSFKSFGWWAARGFWALAQGYRVFKHIDKFFALELRSSIERCFLHLDSILTQYGRRDTIQGYCIPQWMLYKSGSDVTSELLIGLTDYFASESTPRVREVILKLADGLISMQNGDETTFPFGLHRSWRTMWHMWGNGQTQALAYAGKVLSDSTLIESAEREARGFYSRLLINGFFKEMDLTDPSSKVQFEQIAYGVRPMAMGLIKLYEATSRVEYLKMAGLAGSWFFGNNPVRNAMYDSTTGRCYDGVQDSLTINKNSGAESTIEALYTLLELEQYPQAKKYLAYHRARSGSTPEYVFAVFKDVFDNQLTLAIDIKSKNLLLLEENESEAFQSKLR